MDYLTFFTSLHPLLHPVFHPTITTMEGVGRVQKEDGGVGNANIQIINH
jgi:hypothetical protein